MKESLQFDIAFQFDTTRTGISVPATLTHGAESVECEVKIDTGATRCVFNRLYAEMLDIDVESVEAETVSTVIGKFEAFPHTVELDVLGLRTESIVLFAADPAFGRNVLGRVGWLDRIRLGLVDYEGNLFLSPYN